MPDYEVKDVLDALCADAEHIMDELCNENGGEFTSVQFIRRVAQRDQPAYIELLNRVKHRDMPFNAAH